MSSNRLEKILDFTKAFLGNPNITVKLNDEDLKSKLIGFQKVSERSLIIVNDHQRSTPTYKVIRALRDIGKITGAVNFLIATGTHIPPSLEKIAALIGAEAEDKIYFHDNNGSTNFGCAGITSRGTEVYYNTIINEFENVITIGSVEPHYFAGFTGGAKSILPGITSLKTITQNHRWALDISSSIMKTEGNPIFEDIWEGAGRILALDEVRSVQIINHGDAIYDVFTGSLPDAFSKAKIVSKKVFGKNVDRKFDRIISIVDSPLDISLYQAQKAIENCRSVLKKGGTFIMVADCNDGIGNKNFYRCMMKFKVPEDILKSITFNDYQLGDHKAYKFAEAALKYKLFYLGSLNKDIVANVFMEKILETELADLYNKWINNGDSILIDNAGGGVTYSSA